MDEKELYEKVCSPRLANIEATLKENHVEVMTILRGHNSEKTGLIGDVQRLKRINAVICGAVVFIICTLVVQIFILAREIISLKL